MSGHSKWSTIKHKKAKTDAQRGKLFSKLSRAITVAAKEGGGSPEMNYALATAIQKAKDENMPYDNIDRAIKRGTGEIAGVQFETILYEGYGAGGVAVMVDTMTDNRNRTASDIRNIFDRGNGKLGSTGCVSWMFERKGQIMVDRESGIGEEDLLDLVIEAGAEDMKTDDPIQWEILTAPSDLMEVRKALEGKGVIPAKAEVTMLPKNMVTLNESDAKKVLKLIDALEDHDDVQEVYSNFDIPDEILDDLAEAG
jgi:YebC/PmpR family DNA-binding regulatory protein